jgi:hypothetical protein
MHRESDFYNAFTTQLHSATLLVTTLATSAEELAPSDFPAFSLQLGKTSYHGLDNDGFLHLGSQDFVLRIFYKNPQLKLEGALDARSIYISSIESFVSTAFTPLPLTGFESFRITSTELVEILPASYDKLLTTHTIMIKGRYHYVFV